MAEHQQTMSAVKRAMDIAFRVELNTNAAFKRKRAGKTHEQAASLVIKRQPNLDVSQYYQKYG